MNEQMKFLEAMRSRLEEAPAPLNAMRRELQRLLAATNHGKALQ